MVITAKNQLLFEDINLHDAYLDKFEYDVANKIIHMEIINEYDKKYLRMACLNTKYFSATGTEPWGEGDSRIVSWPKSYLGKEYYVKILDSIHKELDTDNLQDIVIDDYVYFTFEFCSGDELTIFCEKLVISIDAI